MSEARTQQQSVSPANTTRRFTTKDGRIVISRRGMPRRYWGDVYHRVLTMPWLHFVIGIFSFYTAINLCFALLYFINPGCIAGIAHWSFIDLFYFSVETLSTIGYGNWSPANRYAHTLVFLESGLGIVFSAVVTGLTFAKFARPEAKVLFANSLIFGEFFGQPALLMRIANGRNNHVVEANVSVSVGKNEVETDGSTFRRLYDLELVRARQPLFSLSWTVVHLLDENSPLWGTTEESLSAQAIFAIVAVTGMDDTYKQQINARHIYHHDDFLFNKRFRDVLHRDEKGEPYIDYAYFHDVEER